MVTVTVYSLRLFFYHVMYGDVMYGDTS